MKIFTIEIVSSVNLQTNQILPEEKRKPFTYQIKLSTEYEHLDEDKILNKVLREYVKEMKGRIPEEYRHLLSVKDDTGKEYEAGKIFWDEIKDN